MRAQPTSRRRGACLLRRSNRPASTVPALDARLLIQHALALDHTALAAAPERKLSESERDAIAQLAARRLSGEPVARILGVKEFWGLPLSLSAATLVPRPETETVVEVALAVIGERRNAPLRIADLGTGTGAILLALLPELPNATGIGTDIDVTAIETAQANADGARAFVARAIRANRFRQRPGFSFAQPFDLVVSNPPYIATGEIAALAREVRDHDPKLALDGGDDGLDAYRTIAAQMPSLLKTDGDGIAGNRHRPGGAGRGDIQTGRLQTDRARKRTSPAFPVRWASGAAITRIRDFEPVGRFPRHMFRRCEDHISEQIQKGTEHDPQHHPGPDRRRCHSDRDAGSPLRPAITVIPPTAIPRIVRTTTATPRNTATVIIARTGTDCLGMICSENRFPLFGIMP